MRELIAERPNTVPAGLGNSETDIDLSVMMTSSEANSGYISEEWDLEDMPVATDDVDSTSLSDTKPAEKSLKRKASKSVENDDTSAKTGAHPGIAMPAT